MPKYLHFLGGLYPRDATEFHSENNKPKIFSTAGWNVPTAKKTLDSQFCPRYERKNNCLYTRDDTGTLTGKDIKKIWRNVKKK